MCRGSLTDLDLAVIFKVESTVCGKARKRIVKALAAASKSCIPTLDAAADVMSFEPFPDAVAAIDILAVETVRPESLTLGRALFSREHQFPCIKVAYGVIADGRVVILGVSPGRVPDGEVIARSGIPKVGVYTAWASVGPAMQPYMARYYYKFVVPNKLADDLRSWMPGSYYERTEHGVDPEVLVQNEKIREALSVVDRARDRLRSMDIFRKVSNQGASSSSPRSSGISVISTLRLLFL
jgi:hypothetical protein